MALLPFFRFISGAITLALSTVVPYVCYLYVFCLGQLPSSDSILPELNKDPVQTNSMEESFELSYAGSDYIIEPKAEYHLYGLVVSHNNIHAFDDIYHSSDSVDIKDLCVIWGENLRDDSYRSVTFRSEPFSCWYELESGELRNNFAHDQLSNNHMLAGNESVRNAIRSARIGDQIEFSGLLVNYAKKETPDQVRKSSLIRTDSGNGACEVVYADEFKLLKTFNHAAYDRFSFGLRTVVALFVLKLFLWWWIPFYRYRTR